MAGASCDGNGQYGVESGDDLQNTAQMTEWRGFVSAKGQPRAIRASLRLGFDFLLLTASRTWTMNSWLFTADDQKDEGFPASGVDSDTGLPFPHLLRTFTRLSAFTEGRGSKAYHMMN
jgi:hypothetical protein